MTIATCSRCGNTGALAERYCDCPAAIALRARIDNDPQIAAARAGLERQLERMAEPIVTFESGRGRIRVVMPSTGTIRITAGNSAGNSAGTPPAEDDETS